MQSGDIDFHRPVPLGKRTKWDICFDRVCEYYREHGNFAVPVKYVTADGVQLGYWCHNVIKRARSGQLKQEKIDRLNAIGFDFTSPSERSWNAYYLAAKRFFEEHGDMSVPVGYSVEGLRLDVWVSQQRLAISAGKIKPARKAMLEDIGIYLTRSQSYFEEGFRRVSEYKRQYGNFYVRIGYVCPDGFELGRWVARHRTWNNTGALQPERKRLLDGIGFCWDVHEAQWEDFYAAACEYSARFGCLDCSRTYRTEDGVNLGAWLSAQKNKYRRGELDAAHAAALEALGVVWNPAKELWLRNYALVKAYYIEHGRHIKSTYLTADGYTLGVWLKNQRRAYRAGKLSAEQAELLEQIYIVSKPVILPIRVDNVSAGGAV